MSFLQTYYTSCEIGLRGGKGFQFNAATADVDPATLQQVERLGLYVPPISLPSRPTPEEIEEFPISLLYQRLADGSVVVAQARYKGTDYSGRFGNYFTHALVSTAPQSDTSLRRFLPIELWMSEDWASEPIPETELPPRNEMQPGGQITLEDTLKFLSERERIECLPAFLTAVTHALSGERRIVIVDDNQNVASWIAVACYAMPSHLALQLTFNTYVKNPYQTDFLLVGTTPDSDFRFAPHELEYQFFVFDFLGDRFSRLDDISCFAATMTALYEQGDADRLTDFGRFVERVAPDLGLAELDAAITGYAGAIGLEAPRMNRAGVIKWLAGRLEAFKPDEIGGILGAALAAKGLDREVVEACTDLYLNARDPGIRQMVEAPYLRTLITEGSALRDTETLDAILRRLPPLDQRGRQIAEPFRTSWFDQVKDVMGPAQLRVMFDLGEKCGFLDDEDEAFTAIGRNVFAPLLRDEAARQALFGIVNKPAFHPIISGIGNHLASDPHAFRASREILSHPIMNQALERYAVEKRNSGLYIRLLTLDQAPKPDRCLQSLQRYITELNHWHGGSVSTQQVDDAFDVIWQGRMPTEDECLKLLDILQAEGVSRSNLQQIIADRIITTEIRKLTPRQRSLIQKLTSDKKTFNGLDQRRQDLLHGYRMAVHFEERLAQGGVSAQNIKEALDFLDNKGDFLTPAVNARIYELLAACVIYLKDVEEQYELLEQGCEKFRSHFIVYYGQAIIDILRRPSDVHYEIMARWFKNQVARDLRQQEKAKSQYPASQIYRESFHNALKKWPSKGLDEIGKRLEDLEDTHQLWNEWRRRNFGSLISKLKFWNRN